MPSGRVAHPSLEERRAAGKASRTRTPRAAHAGWRPVAERPDMKGSAVVEGMQAEALGFYAGIWGWTLARAHARSGDPVALASYLGSATQFDLAIANFAERHADQYDRDYEAFLDAIKSGRLEAQPGK